MPIPSTIADLSTTASLNSPSGSDLVSQGDDYIRALSAIVKAAESRGTAITAASTITPDAAGQYFTVSGSTTIATISATNSWDGRIIHLYFTGTPTITHSANLIIAGGSSVTMAAGDILTLVYEGSSVWRMIGYQKASALGFGGATGAAGNYVFFENDQTVTADYTITSGKNAGTFGSIVINSGVSVTIPSGSVWSIV